MKQCAVFCHASEDAAIARELAAYVELNCGLTVSFELCSLRAGKDLLDAAEHAFSDYLVLLPSPHSVPLPWPRARWERILVNDASQSDTKIAFAFLQPCPFPDVLRKSAFFDLTEDVLKGKRG